MQVFPFEVSFLNKQSQEKRLNQHGLVVWFTGLSGAGKTTLALELSAKLLEKGKIIRLLDGDNIRHGINKDLSFTENDRRENIRRIAEISKLFIESGFIVICCTISPKDTFRQLAREILNQENILEIFVDTELNICEKRDVKGLYAKARNGELPNFSGVNAVFETPCFERVIKLTNNYPEDVVKNVTLILNLVLQRITL